MVRLPGAHTPQWASEADAQCHTQRAFADPCSTGPCQQDLLWALPCQGACQGSGVQYPVGLPCLWSCEQDQPCPGAAAGPGAPAVLGWVSGQRLCSTPGARSELTAAPSPVGPLEQGRSWDTWAQLALAMGQPQLCLWWAPRLRQCWGSCGATPARSYHGGCMHPAAGAWALLSVWCLGVGAASPVWHLRVVRGGHTAGEGCSVLGAEDWPPGGPFGHA